MNVNECINLTKDSEHTWSNILFYGHQLIIDGPSLGIERCSVRQTPLINAATDRQDLKGIWRLGIEEIERGGTGREGLMGAGPENFN